MKTTHQIIQGDCITGMKTLPDNSIHCCVTSPAYFGLRDYRMEGQLGTEDTVEEYVQNLVNVFREVKRILRPDGTLWLNLGDSYMSAKNCAPPPQTLGGQRDMPTTIPGNRKDQKGLKTKDLIGIPWRVAFALQADGWYLRQDIIWCLSGGTHVYTRTATGDSVMMLRDMVRLNPSTVKLWNGNKWTQVLGSSKSKRKGDELEIVLRSGERISCTPTHQFPTERGLLAASELVVGDVFQSTLLPEPEQTMDSVHIGTDAAWFVGLYLAEGSRSEDTIQISGNASEIVRWKRVLRIAHDYGCTATRTIDGNNMTIRVYGKMMNSLINTFISGKVAKNKGLTSRCWKYSNVFLRSLLDGYLSGDGAWDKENNRWRLGFTRNYNLERDIRTLSARLGFSLTLNTSTATFDGREFPSFRGEIRFEGGNKKSNKLSIVTIRKARCREVYDIGVEDEPHLFALASGVLTHNSKPNPMPESVEDRCTKAHEYIFMLSKKSHYYYNHVAIKEDAVGVPHSPGNKNVTQPKEKGARDPALDPDRVWASDGKKNKRSVWTVNTKGYKGAHFAVYPKKLIEPCILAGCPVGGTVFDPFTGSGTTAVVALENGRNFVGTELNPEYVKIAEARIKEEVPQSLDGLFQ